MQSADFILGLKSVLNYHISKKKLVFLCIYKCLQGLPRGISIKIWTSYYKYFWCVVVLAIDFQIFRNIQTIPLIMRFLSAYISYCYYQTLLVILRIINPTHWQKHTKFAYFIRHYVQVHQLLFLIYTTPLATIVVTVHSPPSPHCSL